jgi:hypothetical protein
MTTNVNQRRGNTALQGILSLAVLIGLAWYFFGGGLDHQAAHEMSKIENQVAADAVDRYAIAKRSGTSMDRCAQAGAVAAAYLQAKDEEHYRTWKGIESSDCVAAGVPAESESVPNAPVPDSTQDGRLDLPHIYTVALEPNLVSETPPGSIGARFLKLPWRHPIPTGKVVVRSLVGSNGWGSVVCPDTKTMAAYMNLFDPNQEHKKESDWDTLKRVGCSYFPPNTPMFSEGGNEEGSLAVVSIPLQDGRVLKGVSSPTDLAPSDEQP